MNDKERIRRLKAEIAELREMDRTISGYFERLRELSVGTCSLDEAVGEIVNAIEKRKVEAFDLMEERDAGASPGEGGR